MKDLLRLPFYLRIPFTISLLSTTINILVVLTFYFRVQPVIPLFYTRINPADYLVAKEWLFFFPGFSSFVTIFHVIISKFAFKNYEKLILQLLAWFTVLVQVLLTVILIRILVLVT